MHRNELNGPVHGNVVQTGSFHGDIHVHQQDPEQARRRLHRYLTTVGRADQEHAYSLVSRQAPPLSSIYLARQATRADDSEHPEPSERLQADRLLEHHPGVQVLGYPGMGKSSLLRRLAAETARKWLDDGEGEFVPVLIPAEALTTKATLPDALADGVVHGFSHQLDRSQLVALFGSELDGARWLILVDGLDEVLDPAARHDVLRKIGDLREKPEYRVVVTSRPLERRGFPGRIDQNKYPTFSIEPFTDQELRDFAARMLREQQHATPDEAAADFLARVHRTKLRTLAHVPLISTMLCLLYGENPHDELPNNQSQLYGRFVSWLKTKLREVDVRSLLRNRVRAYGPTAEQAVDELIENVEPLLQKVAYGRQMRQEHDTPRPEFGEVPRESGTAPESRTTRSFLDDAVSCAGVERPASMSADEWAEVIADVLRISGLVIQPGRELRFLHQTVQEYLAACAVAADSDPRTWSGRRVLAPRSRWPWDLLEVHIFLAARWAEEGVDLTRMLRKLLRWPARWRNNIGFIAELARHGVTLDPGVVDRAVRLLRKVVANRKSGSREWQDCLAWLADLDPGRAATELEILANTAPEDRRFEAVRELSSLDTQRAIPHIQEFINDRRVDLKPREALARHLRDIGVEQVNALFTAVTTDNDIGRLRVESAEILISVLGEDVGVLTRLADDGGLDEEEVLGAGEFLLAHNAERGLDMLAGLLRSAEEVDVLRRAARLIGEHAPDRAKAELETVAEDRDAPIERRYYAADLLVLDHGWNTDLLTEIASDRGLDRELRLDAAKTLREDREVVITLVRDIVDDCPAGHSFRLKALEFLAGVDAHAAFDGLAELVRTGRQSDHDRFRAAEIAAKNASGPAAAELYEILASSSSVDSSIRVKAARLALTRHPPSGVTALTAIARDSGAEPPDRHEAALALLRHNRSEGVAALATIGEDRSLPGALRLKALEKAHSQSGNATQTALESLAADTNAADSIRLEATQLIRNRKTTQRLLTALTEEAGHKVRLEAAHELSRIDRRAGLAALRAIESDRRVNRATQEKAKQAADALDS